MVEKRGTDDRYALGITEGFRYQTRHVLYHGLCPNRNVKSFLNHIYGPVRRLDEARNFWVSRHIAGEYMSQTPLSQQYRAAKANESRRLPAQFRHAVVGRLSSFDGGYASLEEALSSFC